MNRNGKSICIVAIVVASVLAMSVPALADDWPMSRNDAGMTGESTETINLPLTEQWHSNAPSVEENGAVVSDGIIYMSTDDGKLYAFEVSTGNMVTGFPVTTANNYGAPAVDSANNQVYVLAGSKLFAFNLVGTTAWTMSVGLTGTNYNVGPIIDEGYVYVKAGNNLQKFDSSGTLQWTSPTAGMNTQPSIMGGYVYVNSESGQIRKYDKATGAEVTTGGFPITTSASIAGLTTVNGNIFHKGTILYAYNAADGSPIWSQPAGGYSTYYDSPAVSNGVVYAYGYDGKMYAFDENTGATMTGFPSVDLSPGGARNWGSPSVADNKVFIGAGQSQKLKVLGAAGTANAGLVLAEYLTFSTDTQGFDLCSPVISDGVVFAMLDGGGLYAFFSSGTEWTGGAIVINNDEECTESRDVTLALDRGSNTDVTEMMISKDPFFAGAVWEAYSSSKSWQLSEGYGTKTVYVQFKDSAGQLSNVFNDQIEYSEICGGEEWTGGAIVINNDEECTESRDVTLALDRGSNTDVTEMIISEDPFFTGAVWEAYSPSKSWQLSEGYGTKTVYVQFRDSTGQLSNVFNDQIEYSGSCGQILTVESSDAAGNIKDTFQLAESVYAIGSGYAPSTTYDLYILDDQTWTGSESLAGAVVTTTVTTDASGNIPVATLIWATAVAGNYDIVVDVNGDGDYNAGTDALDDMDVNDVMTWMLMTRALRQSPSSQQLRFQ